MFGVYVVCQHHSVAEASLYQRLDLLHPLSITRYIHLLAKLVRVVVDTYIVQTRHKEEKTGILDTEYTFIYIVSFPCLSREGGKAWGLLRAHARKIPFIFRKIPRKISDNDVIVHGESAPKEYADTFIYTVTATI